MFQTLVHFVRSSFLTQQPVGEPAKEQLSLEEIVQRTNSLRAKTNWSRLTRYAREAANAEPAKELYVLITANGNSEILTIKQGESIEFGRAVRKATTKGRYQVNVRGIEERHAVLQLAETGIILKDVRGEFAPSNSGTYLNGRELQPSEKQEAKVADEILLGDREAGSLVRIVMIRKEPMDDLIEQSGSRPAINPSL